MKQTLQLRIGQQLTMTPQLQQAIKLLQLSTMELQAEIQEALDSNPMLELTDEGTAEEERVRDAADSDERGENGAEYSAGELERRAQDGGESGADHDNTEVELQEIRSSLEVTGDSDELPVDSVWEDIYENPLPYSGGGDADGREFEGQDGGAETLKEHLLWQMRLTPFTEKDQDIAIALIDAVNDRGYLTVSLEEIHESLHADLDVDLDEVEAVLHRIQHFDPAGVAARDLRECMLIQLQLFDPAMPMLGLAKDLVANHLDLLASRDLQQLLRVLKCNQEDLRQAIALVQSLNPRPGNQVTDRQVEYIVPDVLVRKDKGVWRVELNPEAVPRIRVNPGYAALVRRADNSSDNTYMRNQLQEARWFVKSLQSRNETLLKVASCIVERQRGFLEHGEEAMKALVLHDVATEINMHESTVSRVTTQKYMHTPRGIYELKYFFSSHVSTAEGGECSATAIRALIKKLVASEDNNKPLSDSKIAQVLRQQGINVARRTIAKYRESLAIPSSSERKRLV